MGVLDAFVSVAFRDELAGRVVVFSGDRPEARLRGAVGSRGTKNQIVPQDVLLRAFLHS